MSQQTERPNNIITSPDVLHSAMSILTVGVGGQGVVSFTNILAHTALLDQLHARTAETHGMAQRGGSVSGFLRFGKNVSGPLIPVGWAHVMVSFEPAEALRYIRYTNENTQVFCNTRIVTPLSVYQNRKKFPYPSVEDIESALKKVTPHVYFFDANALAEQAGNVKTTNVVLLGVLFGTGLLNLTRPHLEESILKFIPPKAVEVNKKAFQLGIDKGLKLKEMK